MAQKPKSDDPTKTYLMIGMVCLLLSISWFAYEFLRPKTADEIKEEAEKAKIDAEIARKNAPKPGP